MSNKESFRNIKVGIAINAPAELKLSVNGERLQDYEAQFYALFFDIIEGFITHKKRGVWFKQIDESIPRFVVDIYVDSKDDFAIIYGLISKHGAGDIKLEMMRPYWGFQSFLDDTGQQTPS
jgi:hypothetical protein